MMTLYMSYFYTIKLGLYKIKIHNNFIIVLIFLSSYTSVHSIRNFPIPKKKKKSEINFFFQWSMCEVLGKLGV